MNCVVLVLVKMGLLITDKKEIEGLPATALGLAAQSAVSKVCHIDMFCTFIIFSRYENQLC